MVTEQDNTRTMTAQHVLGGILKESSGRWISSNWKWIGNKPVDLSLNNVEMEAEVFAPAARRPREAKQKAD